MYFTNKTISNNGLVVTRLANENLKNKVTNTN